MARIGLALAGGLAPTDIVECVKRAEDKRYNSAWFAEGHGGDQFSILTACAVATNTILLGTSISSIYVRSVPTIAMAAACVDHYSSGRFILGLGSSHKVQVEPEHGIAYGKPVQRMRETVQVIRSLLSDGQVSYKGEVVLDPFAGSFTTPKVAAELDRVGVGIEMGKKLFKPAIIKRLKAIEPDMFKQKVKYKEFDLSKEKKLNKQI